MRHGFPRPIRGASAMRRDPVVLARRLAPPPANFQRPSGTLWRRRIDGDAAVLLLGKALKNLLNHIHVKKHSGHRSSKCAKNVIQLTRQPHKATDIESFN